MADKYKYQIVAGSHQHSEVVIVSNLVELLEWIERMTIRFGMIDLVYNLGRA